MGKVRIAIAGVGNCASSLVQGLEYYRDADDGARVPGLMHVRFGPYHISDVEVVAAFDVDAKKVGCDLADAGRHGQHGEERRLRGQNRESRQDRSDSKRFHLLTSVRKMKFGR